MKIFISMVLIALGTICSVSGQYYTNQNLNWVFGNKAAVSFSTGGPVPFSYSTMVASEGCASVSDVAGNLLFYTNGKKIWNRLHAVMPSAGSITPYLTDSRTQGALIVPMPLHPRKYYVFSIGEPTVSGPDNHLTWIVVDMTLDGGLGDVDVTAGIANEIPVFPITEKLVSYKADDCNTWIICRSQDGVTFYTIKVTASGISVPLPSPCGFPLFAASSYIGGVCKISHNGTLLAAQSHASDFYGWTELFRFDTLTGVVTSIGVLDSSGYNYGAEFSPDNGKLYTWRDLYTTLPSGLISSLRQICQYDVTLSTVAAIRASRTVIATMAPGARCDLKLAPDGKIYVSDGWSHFLGCIPNPNIAGTSCGYIPHAVDLSPNYSNSGLPNTVIAPTHISTMTEYVFGCMGDSERILHAPAFGTSPYYTWFNGSTSSTASVSGPGTYLVYAQDACSILVDTIHVVIDSLSDIHLGNDTAINAGDSITLNASQAWGTGVYWSTGKYGDTIHVKSAGRYWAFARTEHCVVADTININLATGIANHGKTIMIEVFPNPAGNYLSISASGLKGTMATISFYNLYLRNSGTRDVSFANGQLDTSINIDFLPAGVYAMRLEDEQGNYTTRRIIVR